MKPMTSENPTQKNGKTERGERPADEHSGQAPSPIPPTTTVSQSPPSPYENGKPREKYRDWLDYATMGLQVIGLVVLIAYTTFAFLQWREIQRSTNAAMENFKRDERAWMAFKFMEGNITFNIGKSFFVPTQVMNNGKTPARDVQGKIVVGVFKNGEQLGLDYSPGHAHYQVFAGTIFPTGHIEQSFEGIRHGIPNAEPIILNKPMWEEILSGKSVVVVHGRIEYKDIFGTEHWMTYCRYVLHPELISEECTRYNDADDNN